jgi:Fe2+ or Zn2+ uptake regulation protein
MNFHLTEHSLCLYGVCARCQKASAGS